MTQGRNQTGGAKPQPACSLTPVLRTPADLSIDWLSVTFPVSHKGHVQKDVDGLLVKLAFAAVLQLAALTAFLISREKQ